MRETNKSQAFWDLFVAWTQGGSDAIYRDRHECYEWLKDGDDDALKTMTYEELSKLAEEICAEYERESRENKC